MMTLEELCKKKKDLEEEYFHMCTYFFNEEDDNSDAMYKCMSIADELIELEQQESTLLTEMVF